MKRISVIVFLIGVVSFIACKKTDTTVPVNALPLTFVSLVKTQDTVKVNINDTLIANATGEGLTYNWSEASGFNNFTSINGLSNKILFYGCHATDFLVVCQIKDQYNRSDSKNIIIHVIN